MALDPSLIALGMVETKGLVGAVEAADANDVMLFVDEFMRDPRKLWAMREAAAALGRPRSAEDAAEEILRLLTVQSAVAA